MFRHMCNLFCKRGDGSVCSSKTNEAGSRLKKSKLFLIMNSIRCIVLSSISMVSSASFIGLPLE